MNVLGPIQKDPWAPGLYWRGGDVVRPLNGQWFGPSWPTRVLRFFCPLRILPFLSVRVGRFGFYVGFKVFGVDVEAYRNWLPGEEIFDGSNALCPSARWSASLHKRDIPDAEHAVE